MRLSGIAIWFEGEGRTVERWRYGLSTLPVVSDRRLAELEAYEQGSKESFEPGKPRSPILAGDAATVFEGRGWVGGREVPVLCRGESGHYRLSLEGGCVVDVWIVDGVAHVSVSGGDSASSARLAVLGPGLGLALALGGVFSLHASALMISGGTMLILGESGAGKSTLAASAEGRADAQRVGDDTVPTRLVPGERLEALPHFPQLKLGTDEQWRGKADMKIDRICFLRRDPQVSDPRFEELAGHRAVLRLVENTVASRLFGASLRAAHLNYCVGAAQVTPVIDLVVPDDLTRLGDVLDLLRSAAG